MEISSVSVIAILPILMAALVTLWFVDKLLPMPTQNGRFRSIDGLRGYLAFFVFLHHAGLWFYVLRINQWNYVPSRLFSHFGDTSVSFFFMITAFLFFTKLLNARTNGIDWFSLYVSRFMRIFPLYFFLLLTLFIVVASLSHWKLSAPLIEVLTDGLGWVAFIQPDINGVSGTKYIVAGVVWSLAFEWLFYSLLPIFGILFFSIKASANVLIFSVVMSLVFTTIILTFYSFHMLERMSPFFVGMIAAYVAENKKYQAIAASEYVSVSITILLFVVISFFPNIYSPVPYMCTAIIFIAIAGGNTLFGILSGNLSCILGQISYSIYILHGILLFATFRFITGFSFAREQSDLGHWVIIAACGVALVTICVMTYCFIERPFINLTSTVVDKIRRCLKRRVNVTGGRSPSFP